MVTMMARPIVIHSANVSVGRRKLKTASNKLNKIQYKLNKKTFSTMALKLQQFLKTKVMKSMVTIV